MKIPSKRLLVIAAHPDDEVLGCGATMARCAAQGCEVHVVILSRGISSRNSADEKNTDSKAHNALLGASREANAHLGVSSHSVHDFPDNRMDSLPLLDIIKPIEHTIEQLQPDTVLTHYYNDLNIDHRIVHQAVLTACRPLPMNTLRQLLFFEIPSSTEWQVSQHGGFSPSVYIDVSQTLEKKLEALRIYASEMRSWPHARSLNAVEYLARWRGASAGLDAAEAFVPGRIHL